jgi:LCP family protein required for cell wall assembly
MAVTENLRNGMRAARAGRRAEARVAFQAVLDEDPVNETALLWLGYLADDPHASLTHVTQALEAHPQSPRAYAALRWAWRRVAASPSDAVPERGVAVPPPRPARRRRGAKLAVAGLPALGMLLLLIVMAGWVLGVPLLAESPPKAALASASLDSASPTVTVLPVPSATPRSTLDPAGVPSPTWAPSPSPSPTSAPTPSPTPSSVALVVPDPFPIPGPNAFVPSTTLPIPTPVMPVPVAADAINIVVLGSDQRPDWSEWHTDVVQVVSVQRDRGAVSIISVPRDMYLYIPGFWMSRINCADFYGEAHDYEGGGPALVRDTLLYNLGVRQDHYVRTNFDGLIDIVDTMGGVDIPVHCRLSDYWPYPDENGEYPILTVEPGVHHMDGETALWYARSRKTTSVFSRERRQQQVLQALWHKARDAGMLTRVPALWKQARDVVQTDLTLADVLDLARIALTLEDENVRFYNIGADAVAPWTTPYGGAVFLPRWEGIESIVAEAMAPIPEARLGRTYMPVEVWNGTSNQDWDMLAMDRLLRAGFPAVVGEPDRRDYAQTQLIVFSTCIKGTGAGYLQQEFHISDDQVIHEPDESSTFGFRLIVGADYQTCPYP